MASAQKGGTGVSKNLILSWPQNIFLPVTAGTIMPSKTRGPWRYAFAGALIAPTVARLVYKLRARRATRNGDDDEAI